MTAHNQATEFEIFASDLAPLISSPLTLTAWFHSTDNNLNPVEFFAGTNLLGRADAAPFSVTIGTLPPEEVVLSARTRDLSGHDQFSQPLALTAQAPHIDDLLFGALQVQLQVSLVGIGTTNIIQTSTNLVDWFPIGTNRAAANQFQFVDPDAHQLEQRFYRIAEPR